MADNRDLNQVRADIDAIDQEIQALISRRARCAQRVAAIKQQARLAWARLNQALLVSPLGRVAWCLQPRHPR